MEGRISEFKQKQIQDYIDLYRKLGLDILPVGVHPSDRPVPRLIAGNTWIYEDEKTGSWSVHLYEPMSDMSCEIGSDLAHEGIPSFERLLERLETAAFSLHHALNEDTCGEIFSALEDAEIPLLIDGGQVYGGEQIIQITFEELDALCTRHRKLMVILQGLRWESTRLIVPLMQKHPHLYVEFSNYQANHGIENFVSWFWR